MIKIKAFHKTDLKNKIVLLRVDFNVPIAGNTIQDDSRIRLSLPTIKALRTKGAKIVLVSHLGRPDGKIVKALSLKPICAHLEKLLYTKIKFLDLGDYEKTRKSIAMMKSKEIALLENIRFFSEEEKNDAKFSRKLAATADVFINDAFATAHRDHCSTAGVSEFLPTYSGLLMQAEVKFLQSIMAKNKKPLTLIIGGAKIDTKIGVIENFINKSDNFIFGGGIGNTILIANGHKMGKSLNDATMLKVAKALYLKLKSKRCNVYLPEDFLLEDSINDLKTSKKRRYAALNDIKKDEMALDIGPKSIDRIVNIISKSKTIIWNGPFGVFEHAPYAKGTKAMALAIAAATQKGARSLLGGGDSNDALKKFKISPKRFTYISSGGGAMLEFLEGKIKVKKLK